MVRVASLTRRDLLVALDAPILALLTLGDQQGKDAAQGGLRPERKRG